MHNNPLALIENALCFSGALFAFEITSTLFPHPFRAERNFLLSIFIGLKKRPNATSTIFPSIISHQLLKRQSVPLPEW